MELEFDTGLAVMGGAQSEGVAWVTSGLLDGVCGREMPKEKHYMQAERPTHRAGEQHIGKGKHLCTGHTRPGTCRLQDRSSSRGDELKQD